NATNEIEFKDRKRVSASFAVSCVYSILYDTFISNFSSELNANEPNPEITFMVVYKYLHLIGKENKGGYFLLYPPIFL
ncbi:MAG TPA: hypothetical protein PLT96_07440, partial [Candidatus Cloacimonas sp.]|nr:hypothetical protein [Candidatus Cloacimonas sp.]